MERYQRPQQMLALVFCTCFFLLCAASQDPKPVWQQTQTVIQVIKDCSWTGGEIILFSITLVWKWHHLLWGTSRLGTASSTCVSSGKHRMWALKPAQCTLSKHKPKEKSLHALEMSRFCLIPAITDEIGRRRGFFPSCLTTEVLAQLLIPPLSHFSSDSSFPCFFLLDARPCCPSCAVPGRQLLSWATLTIKMVVKICERRAIYRFHGSAGGERALRSEVWNSNRNLGDTDHIPSSLFLLFWVGHKTKANEAIGAPCPFSWGLFKWGFTSTKSSLEPLNSSRWRKYLGQ